MTAETTYEIVPSRGGRLRVVVASPLGRDGKGGMDRIANTVVSHLEREPSKGIDPTYLTVKGGISKFKGAFVFAWALLRFATLVARGRVDLLHLNVAAYGSVYRKAMLAAIARMAGLPYVVHIHSGRFADFWTGASRLGDGVLRHLLQGSAAVVVLGAGYRALIAERMPLVAERITVLPNATAALLEKPRKYAAGKLKRITYLGLLAPKKGVPELLIALGHLRDRGDWAATLAGHGEVEQARREIERLGIVDRVAVPGWIDAAGVEAVLRETDIFVLPSYSEGLSMAVLEAFAASTAVVTTPVNAMTEVVEHERNGLFVTPGDVSELTAALRRLLDDDALRERLAAAALSDHAARYAIAPYIDDMVGIWRKAVEASRRQ